jgi:hypothetical protein
MAEGKLTVDFPWEVEGGFQQGKMQSLKLTTDLGNAYGGHAVLTDGTLIAFLVDPFGNARFARLRPETDWAIEESRRGKWPPRIRSKLDQTWRDLMDAFAEANREICRLEETS